MRINRQLGGGILGKVEKSIEIRAPPEKVWEMLALDRFQEWMVGSSFASLPVKGMEFTSEVHTPEDKYKVGTSAQPNIKGVKANFKVTESLKNEKITYLIEESGANSTITLVLEPVEEGTKLTYAVNYEMPWGIFGKFIEKSFAKRMGEREVERALGKLKSILEK
jgi:carbon monoxide dehydrogenase subunit G